MTPSKLLQDKVAIVTGAGRGVGQAIARGIVAQGARVALVARSADELDATACAIHDAGGCALAVAGDVSRKEFVDELEARIRIEWGRVDVLVNAAGVFGPIELVRDSDRDRWIETLAINTIGPYLTCRAFVGGMIDRGWGRIVNVSSAAAFHTPGPLNSAYATSKVALNHFTRHLAAELAGTGVTANVIHPGEVKTQMWAAIRDESRSAGPQAAGYRDWAEQVGASGGDDPQKAVDLVLRLIDDRSDPVNGQFLWIEGGIQRPIASW